MRYWLVQLNYWARVRYMITILFIIWFEHKYPMFSSVGNYCLFSFPNPVVKGSCLNFLVHWTKLHLQLSLTWETVVAVKSSCSCVFKLANVFFSKCHEKLFMMSFLRVALSNVAAAWHFIDVLAGVCACISFRILHSSNMYSTLYTHSQDFILVTLHNCALHILHSTLIKFLLFI